MRLGSRRSKPIATGLALPVCLGLALGQLVPPLWKSALIAVAQARYEEATYRCDRAMREHFLAKQYAITSPGQVSDVAVNAAEVGLLDCQDYDLLRKRLILWGLDDNDLSLMALNAIEARADNLQRVIEIHEIRY